MARIRTIKPEFPQSESMGNISREARLLFILLWPICDDHGKTRGSSRLLASLLYPYDKDAPGLIEGWLDELVQQNCIIRYDHEGAEYIKVAKWLEHQKIDRPSASKFPDPPKPREGSTNAREASCEEGKGRDQGRDQGPTAAEIPREGSPEDRDELLGDGAEYGMDETWDDPPADDNPAQTETGTSANGAVTKSIIDEAHALWNAAAKRQGWATVMRLTDARKKALKSRLKEYHGIEAWTAALAKAEASSFLTGKTERSNGHEHWKFNFDFMIKPNSFTKLMEGGYDDRRKSSSKNNGII